MRSRVRHLRTICALAVAVTTPGCFSASFADARVVPGETHEVWLHGYLYGLVGSRDVDARYTCANAVSGVAVVETAPTVTLTLVTLGIYTPRVATVRCASNGAERRSR
ncbi:MAG TPA: hypothetical protein VH062_21890 [Polyangiaceae bacterium]|jgi:hypothetical protein|nr:hypothetical protein [Polyangiaceae bacterium]